MPNALSLAQAVFTPIIASASDVFQARKNLMVGCYILSFVGCAVAASAKNIYGLIGAQILIGFGFSAVALVYTVPSEILPRKWRPSTYWVNELLELMCTDPSGDSDASKYQRCCMRGRLRWSSHHRSFHKG